MKRKLFLALIGVLLFLFFANSINAQYGPPPQSYDCTNRSTECSDKTLFPDDKCEEQEVDPDDLYAGYTFAGCTLSSQTQSARGCRMTSYNSNNRPIKYSCAHVADTAPPPPTTSYNCSNRPPNCPSGIDNFPVCSTPSLYEYCTGEEACPFTGGISPSTTSYCARKAILQDQLCNVIDYLPNHGCAENLRCLSTPEGYKCRSYNQILEAENIAVPCPNTEEFRDQASGICKKIDTQFGNIPTDVANFVQWVLSFILGIAGGIVTLLIIVSGYRLMTSQGNPEKVQAAREQLTSAIVGLLFIIFSLFILQLITVDILKIPGFEP